VPCGVIGEESAEVGLANPLAQAARDYAENHLEDCSSNAGDNCKAGPSRHYEHFGILDINLAKLATRSVLDVSSS
jgi:hypothetical protein